LDCTKPTYCPTAELQINYSSKELTSKKSSENLRSNLPFGELFVEQRSTANYYTPYKFSGKEKDEETSYSYFGARYYMSDVSVWLSVDPLAEDAPGWTPYRYCFQNPIRLIDPDGRFEGVGDGIYTIDKGGKVAKVAKNNNAPDGYTILYNKGDYDSGKRDYDQSGKKSGITFKKSELKNPKQTKHNQEDPWSDHILSFYINFSIEISSQNVADKLLHFLEKNTDVEWGNKLLENSKGSKINLFSTSQQKGVVGGSNDRTLEYQNKGWNVITDAHSHTNNPFGPKRSEEDGDRDYKRDVRLKSPNAKFIIYYHEKPYSY
jgi:RHS repeat-associated protein